jgi:hypothetical protein
MNYGSVLYVAANLDNTFFKVGHTDNYRKRFSKLGENLDLTLSYIVVCHDGRAYDYEQALLAALEQYRQARPEWFTWEGYEPCLELVEAMVDASDGTLELIADNIFDGEVLIYGRRNDTPDELEFLKHEPDVLFSDDLYSEAKHGASLPSYYRFDQSRHNLRRQDAMIKLAKLRGEPVPERE